MLNKQLYFRYYTDEITISISEIIKYKNIWSNKLYVFKR